MRLYDFESKFTTEEFTCPCGCGFGSKEEDISNLLINKLNMMRLLYGKPMVVTSGARCKDYNASVGGVANSAHLPHYWTGGCRAVDILVTTAVQRYTMIRHALNLDIKRIGLAPDFLHFDVDYDLPQPVMFTY
jgi:uncharacterized protein YcbK (DUF882 family)